MLSKMDDDTATNAAVDMLRLRGEVIAAQGGQLQALRVAAWDAGGFARLALRYLATDADYARYWVLGVIAALEGRDVQGALAQAGAVYAADNGTPTSPPAVLPLRSRRRTRLPR